MQLQCELQTVAPPPMETLDAHGEVLPDWGESPPAPAVAVAVELPPAGVTVGNRVSEPEVRVAEPEPVAPRPPSSPEKISRAIQDLVHLLPGKPAAVGLENGLIGIIMCLDPETQRLTVPFLDEHCDFQPYVPPPVDAGPSLNAHILIVEDAYISRLVLRRLIEQLPGCTVTEAVDGAEALDLLQKDLNPDLIISDICMPEMDGLQLLSRIRATPYLKDLEVVMCTSTTDRDSVVRAAELNVTNYLIKPFKPEEVRAKIRGILTQGAIRTTERVQDLKDRLGLSPSACGELFHQLAEQVREEIRTTRNELGAGRTHAATLTLQRLRGSCALIKDSNLVARVQAVINSTSSNDMFSIVKGLEVLEGEGRRLGALAARLRNHAEPGKPRLDPLAAAVRRVCST